MGAVTAEVKPSGEEPRAEQPAGGGAGEGLQQRRDILRLAVMVVPAGSAAPVNRMANEIRPPSGMNSAMPRSSCFHARRAHRRHLPQ
jgi:hypothetical protein